MSNVRQIINIGADTVVDVDGVYNPPEVAGFTFDSTVIRLDTTNRTFDENS
jgi:hypothetical protein